MEMSPLWVKVPHPGHVWLFVHFLGVMMFIYVFLVQNTVRQNFERKKCYSHFLFTVEIYKEIE